MTDVTISKFNRPSSEVFHAITVVWGRAYLDLFLNRCIPNQLGEGNLPALPDGSRYRIMTRAMHVDEVRAHPMVQALAQVVPVDVVSVAALEGVDQPDPTRRRDRRFELMTVCHRRAIGDALAADAALIFLAPDIVLSAGAFASIVQRHRAGYRAVACTGLRVEKESFFEAIDDFSSARALPPRDLVRLALPRLHAHTRSMFVDAKAFSAFPTGVYWPVGTKGLLARRLHLHPIMIDPTDGHVMPKGTIDADFLARACPDAARVHIVTDSDEFVIFELTGADRFVHMRDKPATPESRQALVDIGALRSTGAGVSVWRAATVAARCDEVQVGYWQRHPVRIHSEALDERWVAIGETSEAFVRAVMWRCRPFGIRSSRWFKCLERTRQLHDQHRRAWSRRLPRVRLKKILRPVRLAKSRVSKTLRKTTNQILRHVGVHSR